jgi:hypothetical protein
MLGSRLRRRKQIQEARELLRAAREGFDSLGAGLWADRAREDLFISGDKLAITLIWRGTHTGAYGGVAATGKPVEVRDTAIWHFRGGNVTEILTLQDQFAILKQIGYLPDSVYAA